MTWTDERTETLKTLWAEGLSASQIAERLGGVTRNAVIGKANRIGLLNGRPRPKRSRKPRKPLASPLSGHRAGDGPERKQGLPQLPPVDKTRRQKTVGKSSIGYDPGPSEMPSPQPCSFEELTQTTCRFPIGDPGDPDFHFCGHYCEVSDNYCEYHAELARRTTDAPRRNQQPNRERNRPYESRNAANF